MKRLHNLDYLRGLAAFSIMLYHFQSWAIGSFTADTFWGRIGLYGVSIFYILSGLTLYLVNRKQLVPKAFFIKRFFRIYPLLIFATLATIILHRSLPPIKMILLNLTGLFGFVTPRGYIATGAWSIGNELVFYALFPVLWSLLKFHKSWVLWLAGGGLFCLYAFYLLSPTAQMADQWATYVNPLNQVPYFMVGLLIAHYLDTKELSVWQNAALFLIGIAVFVGLPTGANLSELVAGVQRLFFTLSITLICTAFFKSESQLHPVFHKPLSILGEASYSVYLLHPLVWAVAQKGLPYVNAWVVIVVAAAASIAGGYVVYRYFEMYFIGYGKWLTKEKKEAFAPPFSK